VCIPHVNLTYLAWAIRFRRLLFPFTVVYSTSRGHPIDVARNNLVLNILKDYNSVKWIFFLDADVLPPPDSFFKLAQWKLPIVSGIYYSKNKSWCVYVKDEKEEVYHPLSAWEGDLLRVDAVGMGCCLIDKRVFEVVPNPWFNWTLGKENPGFSEDIDFCRKANKYGFPIYVDTRVKCEHIEPMKLIGKDEVDWLEV